MVVSYLWAVIQRNRAETGHSTVPQKTNFACHSLLTQPQPGVFLLSVCPPSQSFVAEAGRGRGVLHKLTLQALTNEFLPPPFVEITSHLGDGSGFFSEK